MFTKIRAVSIMAGCVTLAGLLGACTAIPPVPPGGATGASGGSVPRTTAGVNLSGYPPAFKDGFSDGCESLRGACRFGKDNDYTLGWQDGYSICARQKR